MKKRSVSIVIGSGSVKCAAALGLQKVLLREGIDVDLVVGCSAGAIYAFTIAAGWEPARAQETAMRIWTRELTSRRDRGSLLRAIFPRMLGFKPEFGLIDDGQVNAAMRAVMDGHTMESMKIPFFVAATDFETGDQVVIEKGPVFDAVRASIAIPFAFPPWRVDGKLLVDGFVSDPLPVNVAIREGAEIIVAMGFESPLQTRIDSAGRFAFQLSSLMTNNLLKARFAFHNLAHHAEVIPIVPLFEDRIRLFDTAKVPQIVEAGARATEEQLPYLEKLLASRA